MRQRRGDSHVELRLVANSDDECHADVVRNTFQRASGSVLIASPYLSAKPESLLGLFDFGAIKEFTLVTTFKARDPEQITKPPILAQFFDYFDAVPSNARFKLHINNRLHGKVYLNESDVSNLALVTSANFTRNGLYENDEWGFLVKDSPVISQLRAQIWGSIEFEDVTRHQVQKACRFAEQYKQMKPEWTEAPDIYSDILNDVYSVEAEVGGGQKYFLKPIGTSEEPITLDDKRDFSDLHQNLHFSKKRPKGVRKGDVVITTAVGPGSLVGYFKVTGPTEYVTREMLQREAWLERWPWYMEGKSQLQEFSRTWWQHNIRRQDALTEFLKAHPGVAVTAAGGRTLNTLNRGNDKVEVTQEFGEFLIEKMRRAVGA